MFWAGMASDYSSTHPRIWSHSWCVVSLWLWPPAFVLEVPEPVVSGSLASLSARCGPAVLAVRHWLIVDLDCCREPLA